MKIKIVLHVLSVLMLIISLFIIMSALVALYYNEIPTVIAFLKTLAILIFTGHSLQSTHPTPNVGMRHSFFCVNEHEGSFGHVNN